MRVLLDNQPIDCTPDRPTLGAAIDAGRLAAQRRGRVIVEVRVDGQALSGEALHGAEQQDFPAAEVRLTSADTAALVRSTFLEVADAMAGAREEQDAAARALQVGKIEDAFGHLVTAIGVWENVRQAVMNGPSLLGLPLDTLRVRPAGSPEIGIAEAVGSLTDRLREVKRSMQERDWTGLADVLAYDMRDLTDTWRTILAGLADQAASWAPMPHPPTGTPIAEPNSG